MCVLPLRVSKALYWLLMPSGVMITAQKDVSSLSGHSGHALSSRRNSLGSVSAALGGGGSRVNSVNLPAISQHE